jgi:two-component system, chemotaxis family, response regulator Rcp1
MSLPKILLVDDNIADIRLLRYALEEQGEPYELQVLQTGEDALRFIEEHGKANSEPDPGVILLDLHLPRYDGIALLKAIKQSAELAQAKAVVLSGFANPMERVKIEELGAVYIQKPSDLTHYLELGARIIDLCDAHLQAVA